MWTADSPCYNENIWFHCQWELSTKIQKTNQKWYIDIDPCYEISKTTIGKHKKKIVRKLKEIAQLSVFIGYYRTVF